MYEVTDTKTPISDNESTPLVVKIQTYSDTFEQEIDALRALSDDTTAVRSAGCPKLHDSGTLLFMDESFSAANCVSR